MRGANVAPSSAKGHAEFPAPFFQEFRWTRPRSLREGASSTAEVENHRDHHCMTQHQSASPEANAPVRAILLVEDNPDDVLLTLRALQKNNLHGLVQVVRDGAEALDYLFATGAFVGRDTAQQPRLILLDLNLPKLNGLEVLDRIRADRRTRFLPVIAFTASMAERDIVASYMGGANSCVIKPADLAGFAEALRQIWHYWSVTNFVPPVPVTDAAPRTEAQS